MGTSSWSRAALALIAALSPLEAAEESRGTLECRILQETPDGLYLDAGSAAGVEKGMAGRVLRDGIEVGRVEVVQTTRSGSLARVVSPAAGLRAGTRDRVVFDVAAPTESEPAPSPAPGASPAREEPFIPLLVPIPDRAAGYTDPRNIFHGRLRLQQLFIIDEENGRDGYRSRMGSDGTLERIAGGPWNLEWSGNLYHSGGDAYDGTSSFETARLNLYRLAFHRRFDEGGLVRAGRFLPYQLPAVGYVDGAQGEAVLSDWLRVGAVAGLKPDRITLDPSGDEPLAAAYATVEAGTPRKLYYSGTAGVLGTLFEGEMDRLAALLDQAIDLGPKLALRSSMEVDFDVGGAEFREGTRLTRLNVYADSPITDFLSFRAGVDHDERPDLEAERDLFSAPDERWFDRGFWRYWVGSTQRLPWRITLDEEVALHDAPEEDYDPFWRITVSRSGNFLRGDGISVSIYSLEGFGVEGYGGRAWAYLPVLESRLALRPAVGFRWVETVETEREFDVTELSLYADWWISRRWSAYLGATQFLGESLQATLVDLGVDYRW